MEKAFDEAEKFKDEFVSTEHILLAIAGRERDPAGQLLVRHGASRDAILQALAAVRGSHRVTSANSRELHFARSNSTRAISPKWPAAASSIR